MANKITVFGSHPIISMCKLVAYLLDTYCIIMIIIIMCTTYVYRFLYRKRSKPRLNQKRENDRIG